MEEANVQLWLQILVARLRGLNTVIVYHTPILKILITFTFVHMKSIHVIACAYKSDTRGVVIVHVFTCMQFTCLVHSVVVASVCGRAEAVP